MKSYLILLAFLGLMIQSCTSKSEVKIFVYGSLREGFHNYERYLTDKVVKNEIGTVQGELYVLDGYGYPALISGTNTIFGEIITLQGDTDKILQELDALECYYGENVITNEYDKIISSVFNTVTQKEEQLPVYFYNMKNPDVDPSIMLPIQEGDWKIYTQKYPQALRREE